MLVDKESIIQVLGSIIQKPSLLNDYNVWREDFPELFHELIFATVVNLKNNGIEKITEVSIDSYLSNYPRQYEVFDKNNGIDYVQSAIEYSEPDNFKYYFDKMRKCTLLRRYQKIGVDISEVYNPNLPSPTEREKLQAELEKMSVRDIIDKITTPQVELKDDFLNDDTIVTVSGGEDIFDLIKSYEKAPDYGAPFMGDIHTTLTDGMKIGELHLTSGSTGSGKTRIALGEATRIGTTKYYDLKNKCWVSSGGALPVVFITTEIETYKIQTMMLAHLSGVPDKKIRKNLCSTEEKQRVLEAAKILKESEDTLKIIYMPDFDVNDIMREVKKHHRKHKVRHVFFDYMHTTLKVITELTKGTGIKASEEMVLRMFSIKLKKFCLEEGIYLHTSTQLNNSYQTGEPMNEGVLRGAKAIADKIDFGMINIPPTQEDLETVSESFLGSFGMELPNMVSHVFKNRHGDMVKVKIWSRVDLGICRVEDMFLTDDNNNLITIETLKLKVEDDKIKKDEGKSIDF